MTKEGKGKMADEARGVMKKHHHMSKADGS